MRHHGVVAKLGFAFFGRERWSFPGCVRAGWIFEGCVAGAIRGSLARCGTAGLGRFRCGGSSRFCSVGGGVLQFRKLGLGTLCALGGGADGLCLFVDEDGLIENHFALCHGALLLNVLNLLNLLSLLTISYPPICFFFASADF